MLLKCQYVGTIRCFIDQSYNVKVSKKSRLLILPHIDYVDRCTGIWIQKQSKPDMQKKKIVNTIGNMGWKESRNLKVWISACVL